MTLVVPATASLGQEQPIPVDELGEEVFGEGYLPRATASIGADYYLARPNAGFVVPPELLVLPQRVFRTIDVESMPLDRRQLPTSPFGVPVRSDMTIPGTPVSDSRLMSLPPSRPDMPSTAELPESSTLFVHFVDVGQGAGAILEFPCGVLVIDAGGGSGVDGDQLFADYLASFFETRPHLDNTIDSIFLSHPHADHIDGVDHLFPAAGDPPYTILNVVDDGLEGDRSGLLKQTEFKTRAIELGAGYTGVLVAEQVTMTGIATDAVDPLVCDEIDPLISAFWGGRPELASEGPYKDINNHSVVVRVDFGLASFLFVGDLEDQGATDMLDLYSTNPGVFDADVYLVSHHGADQGTTDSMLAAITPRIAVISMGKPDEPNTVRYGHPRVSTLGDLHDAPDIVSDDHPDGTQIVLASPASNADFVEVEVDKAIYATGWQGTIVVKATADGQYTVESIAQN